MPSAVTPVRPSPTPHQVEPFVAPGKPPAQLERWLHQASTQLCDWLGHAADSSPLPTLSVVPPVEPEAIGRSPGQLLADLQLVMDGAFNPGHPGALAHLDPPPLTASIVADLICAGLNNNLLAEELSPSLSHLERNLCRWLAESLGLPEGSGGVPASGGSLCNLMALVAARRSRGLGSRDDAVVLCGADAHVSLRKAVAVMGLPPSCLRHVPIDRQGRLQPEALEDQLTGLSRQGIPVIAVVATAGTTVRGAVDPLPSVASLCRRHGVWLHVDGAIGAVFALSPHHRPLMAGLEQADSITMNPQKLLGITKTSALLLVADRGVLHEAFATGLPYMEPSWGGGHGGECGLQGTRPAEILKLWLGLRQLGLEGIAELIDAAIERRHRLESMLASDRRLLILAGPLHLLAFRPADVSPAAAEAWSDRTRQILLEHQLMLSRPGYRGYHHLKAVLGNPHTRHQDLERLAAIVHRGLDEL